MRVCSTYSHCVNTGAAGIGRSGATRRGLIADRKGGSGTRTASDSWGGGGRSKQGDSARSCRSGGSSSLTYVNSMAARRLRKPKKEKNPVCTHPHFQLGSAPWGSKSNPLNFLLISLSFQQRIVAAASQGPSSVPLVTLLLMLVPGRGTR